MYHPQMTLGHIIKICRKVLLCVKMFNLNLPYAIPHAIPLLSIRGRVQQFEKLLFFEVFVAPNHPVFWIRYSLDFSISEQFYQINVLNETKLPVSIIDERKNS